MLFSSLKQTLQLLCGHSLPEKELSRLVHTSRLIIQKYLLHFRSSLSALSENIGLSASDIAYDCLGEIFARDKDNTFHRIEEFISHLEKGFDDTSETEIFFAYEGLLSAVADAHLARLYAQADPTGAKILRNIRDTVKKTFFFSLHKDFRGSVLIPNNIESLDHLPEFPLEQLSARFILKTNRDNTTGQLLEILFRILTEQQTFRRSVPLNDIVQLFKKIYPAQSGAEISENEDGEFSLHVVDGAFTQFELDQMRLHVEETVKEKIFLTYYTKGKVDKKQAESLFYAMQDVITDWMYSQDGQETLRPYIQKYLRLDDAAYENNFRLKMEYLRKIAREEFAKRLTKEI
ncbi:MAG: hypothetical protein KGZ58_08965 [Ignavibacteriales bacterium]|nr:hypothetical protein [Ignavibacteriales bacterium]